MYGTIGVFLVKNWTSGAPTSGQILDSEVVGYGGVTGTFSYNLDSGYQNFNNGDTVRVVIYRNTSTSPTWNFGITGGNPDFFTSTNQISPTGVVNTPYWHFTSSTDTWLTGSTALSSLYGALQLGHDPDYDPIIQDFTAKVGDEIRFRGSEVYSRMITDIVLPGDDPEGKLKLKLTSTVTSGSAASGSQYQTLLDHFLLRRYVDDASYVIIDTTKPLGSTSPGTIRPEFVTDLLDTNFSAATEAIIKSIT